MPAKANKPITTREASAIAGDAYFLDTWILENIDVVGQFRTPLKRWHGDFLPVATQWRFQAVEGYICSCGTMVGVEAALLSTPEDRVAQLRVWAAAHLLKGTHSRGVAGVAADDSK